MATEISGRNFEVTPDIKALLEKKLAKIEGRLFDGVIDVRVVLQVEKYRNICEILIKGKEHDVKVAQQSDESMLDAINLALDHVKRQAQKNRKTLRDHHRKDGNHAKVAVSNWTVNVLEPGKLREPGNGGAPRAPRIIKSTELPIRPMSIEEAALRLDDSRSEFIVFRDLDTDRISVIYKRRDNNLGLIAPEV